MMAGKTRICRTLAGEDCDSDNYEPTIGLDLFSISRFLNCDKYYKIHLLDTSGDHYYLPIIRSYFHASALVIIVVDLRKGQPIEDVKEWIDESRRSAKIPNSKRNSIQIAVFSNRGHEDRNMSGLAELTRTENILFFEMDFSNRDEVSNAFDAIVGYIDNTFIRHFDRIPGIIYSGVTDSKDNDRTPLVTSDEDTIAKDGCCSIL